MHRQLVVLALVRWPPVAAWLPGACCCLTAYAADSAFAAVLPRRLATGGSCGMLLGVEAHGGSGPRGLATTTLCSERADLGQDLLAEDPDLLSQIGQVLDVDPGPGSQRERIGE